jgi:hypothetical protein
MVAAGVGVTYRVAKYLRSRVFVLSQLRDSCLSQDLSDPLPFFESSRMYQQKNIFAVGLFLVLRKESGLF